VGGGVFVVGFVGSGGVNPTHPQFFVVPPPTPPGGGGGGGGAEWPTSPTRLLRLANLTKTRDAVRRRLSERKDGYNRLEFTIQSELPPQFCRSDWLPGLAEGHHQFALGREFINPVRVKRRRPESHHTPPNNHRLKAIPRIM